MEVRPPFSSDFLEKRFFYLRKTSTGRYDLFLAIPLAPGKNITVPNVSYNGEAAKISFEIVNDNTFNAQRILGLVIGNIQVNAGAIKYIVLDSLIRIAPEDADLVDLSEDEDIIPSGPNVIILNQWAINCPYLCIPHMIGTIIGPKVLVPLMSYTIIQDTSQLNQNVSVSGLLEMVSRIRIKPTEPSPTIRWEEAMFIGQYQVGNNFNELDGFEVQLIEIDRSGEGRKTKVKHKNVVTRIIQGGISDSLRQLYIHLRSLVRRFFQ